MVVLKLNKPSTSDGPHFVLATEVALDVTGQKTFKVHDPGRLAPVLVDLSDPIVKTKYPSIGGARIFHPAADPSMIMAHSSPNVHFVIEDSKRDRVGFDPINGNSYEEIPNASYYQAAIGSPNEPEYQPDVFDPEMALSMPNNVVDGEFKVKIFGTQSGNYYFNALSFDTDGYFNDRNETSGVIKAGEIKIFVFKHTSDKLPDFNGILNVSEIFIERNVSKLSPLVMISGAIKSTSNSLFRFQNQIEFRVGGLSGAKFILPLNKFRRTVKSKGFDWKYIGNDNIEMTIDSEGNFKAKLDSRDLISVPDDKRGQVIMKVDELSAAADVKLNCNTKTCIGK